MSSRPAYQNPREWLQQQLDELGELRNAGTRAPAFRAWRQSTLTAIQRSWPGDPSRSERFRRIPFSAPSSRADGREMREWYERGCAEAAVLLKQFVDEAPAADAARAALAAPAAPDAPGTFEDDFPMLDLPGAPAAPKPTAKPAAQQKPAPPPPAPSSPAAPHAGDKARAHGNGHRSKAGKPHKKAARRLKDMLGLNQFEAKGEEVAPPAEAVAPPAPVPAQESRREPAIDPLLTSDMLRMIEHGMRGAEPAAPPAPSAPPPAIEPLEVVDMRETPPVESFDAIDPAPRRAADVAPPLEGMDLQRFDPRLVRAIRMSTLAADPAFESGAAAAGTANDASNAEQAVEHELDRAAIEPIAASVVRLPDPVPPPAAELPAAIAPVEPPPSVSLTPPEAVSPLEPSAPPADVAALDEALEDAESATELFFRTSPVLTSRAQPVRKRAPSGTDEQVADLDDEPADAEAPAPPPAPAPVPVVEPEPARLSEVMLHSPAALGVQALASSVGRLGVPEGHRARARATLADLARQLETGELAWDDLRDAVAFAMEFPSLAVRLVPLLLPYFEDAA